MYIYTHTVGYCEKPAEAETRSTMSLTFLSLYSSVIRSESSTGTRCARPKPARLTLLGGMVLREHSGPNVLPSWITGLQERSGLSRAPAGVPGVPAAAEPCLPALTRGERGALSAQLALEKRSAQPTLSKS